MRILIIEDEKTLTTVLEKKLSAHFAVDIANDGRAGLHMASISDYDLIMLDYHLPEIPGATVCQEIRQRGKNCPILMLSVETDIPRKIELLNLGADDYMTKPFSYEELYARIKAMLRRPKGLVQPVLSIDNVTLNTTTHEIHRGKKELHLTKKEFMLLEYFMRNQNTVLSRGMLMEHVWDMNGDLFSNTIEMHIATLRKKLDHPGKRPLIHTVPGRGYKLTLKK